MLLIMMGVIVFLLTVGYFFLMFFYPEWVGMSGEKTKQVLSEQQDEADSSETSSK